ncbi:sigma-70 family RNA polymerase sigma factor [Ancylobacter dichloromethanicus]|uniref:RNA polymerase sigma factor n=1 Tax=Ancylobacter dichloromethanicus TaxID=518825 RepID=A0A9W6MXF3_9HYPH|nr:sigma-70 family RNA polymerase sigma factor [Ancylobacter dichloromethanicus]MBS7555342.1 sigma-70 family RNA polymerase sigma factor [Ancylobacter dichloromethanicus]GLK70524.1 RNA polymerase sigma factor [Ancylobacter dichloromethanicus]
MTTLLHTADGAADDELAEALRGCARGERAGLHRLYERLAPKMTGVALRMLRRRDLADEVVHDTFLRIWEKAGSFDAARGKPSSWVFAILRNTALNVLRGEKRTELVDSFEAIEPATEEADAETLVLALSESSALRRCLDRLEPQRRRAILLAYMRGLTHGELAGRLGVPLGTAKAWIRRSLLTLRECMT